MDKQQTPEENLKKDIHDIYTNLFYETVSDQRQKYFGQIWEKIVLWWDKFNYHKIDAIEIDGILISEMADEIFSVIKRLVKDNNKTVKNKSDFFYILKKSMKNAENEYIRKDEQSSIKISREKKRKLREIEDFIRMKESLVGRKLNKEEEEQCISKWFKKQEYINLINTSNVGSISYLNKNENDEINDIDVADPHTIDSLDKINIKTEAEYVIEAVKAVLDKKKEKTRKCFKALFTLHCIENNKYLEDISHVLDKKIIKDWQKTGKCPNQYEIYQQYHPKAKESSVNTMASKDRDQFISDVKNYLKNKYKISL